MEMKTSTLILLAIVLSFIAGGLLYFSEIVREYRVSLIQNFDDCTAAWYPITESYPMQCRTPDGRVFVNPREPVEQAPTLLVGPVASGGCAVAGCSKEICAEVSEASGIVSPCVYLPQFACYKSARCERQNDDTCGWTQTPELQTCIAAAAKIDVQPMSN